MDKQIRDKLIALFKKYQIIKLVYFFGSKANNSDGVLSDYDLAFYLDEKNKKKRSAIKLKLFSEIGRILNSDAIDIVVLNDTQNPELKYNIISTGKLIYCQDPFKVILEPRILNQYFDFRQSLLKYNLTKAYD